MSAGARAYPPDFIRAVSIAGRSGWDGVTEAVMAHGPVVERKASRLLERLGEQGYTLARDADPWQCACGYNNIGPICAHCGADAKGSSTPVADGDGA
jgi:hypothetical protein